MPVAVYFAYECVVEKKRVSLIHRRRLQRLRPGVNWRCTGTTHNEIVASPSLFAMDVLLREIPPIVIASKAISGEMLRLIGPHHSRTEWPKSLLSLENHSMYTRSPHDRAIDGHHG